MAHKSGMRGRSRDLGLNHGPGKGSANRVDNVAEYQKNYEAIDWHRGAPKPKTLEDYIEDLFQDEEKRLWEKDTNLPLVDNNLPRGNKKT